MNLLRKAYYSLGPVQRRLARRLVFLPADLVDSVSGKRLPLVPPRGKIFTGQGDFVAAGDELLGNMISTCNLEPGHHVLDIGCGIGRLARPLTGFLDEKGSYEGFDIVKDGVEWCKKHYVNFSNFNFTYIALQNDLYNLESNAGADKFAFPYPDSAFDLAALISVFTHMQPGEVENYLQEIGRVLKPGGHCFATFFLITRNSEIFLDDARNPFFPHRYNNYFLHNNKVKNANIAYRYEFISKLAAKAGLSIQYHNEGWWAGKSQDACMNFQDLVVMTKG
jgi:ubiquinone/menaquinone biosynthesis C-methylase UbiE